MNYENQQIQFDERVDRYLRGKMSEEEELEFEIEYLDNPDLLAQVEMVERLIRGLKLNEATLSQAAHVAELGAVYNTKAAEPTFGEKVKQWLSDFFTPQAAWGAVAAALFIVPLMSVINTTPNPEVNAVQQVQGTTLHLLGQRVRSTTKAEDVIYIEPQQGNLVVGFTTEPTFGVPEPLTVTVYNEQDQIVWQQANLQPDYRWTVYLSVNSSALQPGQYRYELSNSEETVTSGTFAMQFPEP